MPIGSAAQPGLLDLHAPAGAWNVRELVTTWLERVANVAGGPLECRTDAWSDARARTIRAAAARFRDPAWLARR